MRKTLLTTCMLLLAVISVYAQSRTVTGRVTSADEPEGIPGANILVKGTGVGTATDLDGRFSIAVNSNDDVLVFSFVGYDPQEIRVGNQSEINVSLVPDTETLGEIIVVGYGEQDRRTLTSSISSIKGKDVENLPITSPDQLLQGRAPGVVVNSESGEPGGGMNIRIRGTTSITGNSDPLYVIDGVPIISDNIAATTFGQPVNPLADLNPADIESMEILKDASATAIYGARAANGVVLITTKRGKSGKPVVNISMFGGISEPWRSPNDIRVDGPTFERLQNEASRNNWIDRNGSLDNPNSAGQAYQAPFPNPDEAIDTNWFDEIFQTGSIRSLDASVAGGDDRIKYFVSANNFAQEGLVRPASFERNSGRMNLDFMVTPRLKIGTSATYSVNTRDRALNGNAIEGSLSTAFFYPSNFPIREDDGSYFRPFWENPVAVANETEYLMKTTRLIGSVFADWEITDGLVFKSTWSIDNNLVEEDRYFNTFLAAGAALNGSAQSFVTRSNNWINENVLTYQKNFGDHNLNILLGNTLQENQFLRTQAFGQGFPSNSFKRIESAAVKNSSSTGTSWGIASFFSRVNYGYKGKYLFTANMRADASSRFGIDNRWGYFPSVAGAWRMIDEGFMESVRGTVSDLKFRASYGITGNQGGIQDFQSLGLWGGMRGGLNLGGVGQPGGPASYVDAPGIAPNQLANPDLRWETTAQFNIGVDVGFWNDKLTLTFDYYDKQTKDLLLNVPVPKSTGFSILTQNFGEMENKGFELGINASIIERENFTWTSSFNVSRNNNLVKRLAFPFSTFTRDYVRVEEGYPLNSFWVHVQEGVDPETGDIIWDTMGDEEFNPNVHRQIMGNAIPRYVGGWTNMVNYKNWDFMIFFQFAEGLNTLNYGRFFFEHGGERNTGYSAQQLDRWQQPGDITDVPRMASRNYSADLRPSRHVEDGSFLRLKNTSIGYTLPTPITQRVGVSRARFYAAAQNLLTWTGYSGLDPEVSTSPSNLVSGVDIAVMPQPRTYTLGVNLTF
ncbi:MAG: TonB-dependent receptor [Mongoliibacter sp.]|uniref:SusC/RagA family TonB-linked outer membrane protein n=1 Tax=Mongoliibacter sp. TaxID=2022438 RepID=UPI0012F1563A|nr:TonB-dependent receptor [Mongoliibacter sp.]TVP50849.1 MAG: TonB-dependent receptor [Mongoliibacter sp.]